jgi:hypothetical protein
LDASPNIQAEFQWAHQKVVGEKAPFPDEWFLPGRHDVYILGDLPAECLTPSQQRMLVDAVEKGAGLLMLGGRKSFGPGGWGSTELARLLPTNVRQDDGQLEPDSGIRFIPSNTGLDAPFLQIGPTKAESARLWAAMPPMTGSNRLGEPKFNARIYGHADGPDPIPVMISIEPTTVSRVLGFGGETWVWARGSDEGRLAHQKFWRQVIFWLAHKEDKGENEIKITLDSRRIAVGQKLPITVTARDAKGVDITGVTYETKVEREGSSAAPEPVDVFNQGKQAYGAYFATGQPGDYRVTVVASKDGQVLGRDSARFIVYQDDRELENPAADLALLREIAQITGGTFLPPEQLPKYLRSLDSSVLSEYVSQTERRVWDTWPFFLIFTALMTLEWWLRKRHGWV